MAGGDNNRVVLILIWNWSVTNKLMYKYTQYVNNKTCLAKNKYLYFDYTNPYARFKIEK